MASAEEKVTAYIEKKGDGWKGSTLKELRSILVSCDLEEGVKWGAPTYMNNGNVASIAAFKNHVALWFYQGVFLKDPSQVLMSANESTDALRQWRFVEGDELDRDLIKAYIEEAIENSLAGKKTKPKKQTKQDAIPEVFANALSNSPRAKENFEAMSFGKRNEFIQHIDSAAKEETKVRRVAKVMELLEANLDLNHKYRK
ncbi:DUF1801 domain-containing protein [Phaeocystidibacter luteus]|uniref:YdhG-like domain-containing protein n=1 Tax=Phaeocystidibacter luteus TaxID=911197 RepID=A0A6N6RIK6_9FLAO|nr:DUF1801 domain-containing protein [Phaeocystidibacter luteus]KAB2810203.1 hypothetical protein F8C67_08185 [Phaeocystidibacter luteus]